MLDLCAIWTRACRGLKKNSFGNAESETCQCTLTQLVPPPLFSVMWSVMSWVQDPLDVDAT